MPVALSSFTVPDEQPENLITPDEAVLKGMAWIREFYQDEDYQLIPKSMRDKDFIPFLVTASNINQKLLNGKIATVMVDDKSTETYTDGKNVYIGGVFLLPEYYEKTFGITDPYEQVLCAIALFNGFLIHEASHIVRPSPSVKEMMQAMFPADDEIEMRMNKLAAGVLNITEDIHVDKFALSKDQLTIFNTVKNKNFVFTPEEQQRRLDEYMSNPTVKGAVSLLATAKNGSLSPMRYMNLKDAVRIAREAAVEDFKLKVTTSEVRSEIARRAWDALLEAVEQDKEDKKKCEGQDEASADADAKQEIEDELNNQQGEPGENEKHGEGDGDFSEALEQALQEMMANLTEEQKQQLAQSASKLEKDIEKKIQQRPAHEENQPKDKPDAHLQKIVESEIIDGEKTHVSDVLYYESQGRTKNVLRKEFNNFPEVLRAVRSRRSMRYSIQDEGYEIVEDELWRYGVDRKILGSITVPKNKKSYPETILLIDVSGSTYANIYDPSAKKENRVPEERKGYTLKQDMLEIAKTCFDAMTWAGMSVSVYTHSTGSAPDGSGSGSGYGCQITAIAANNMPFIKNNIPMCTSNNEKRFEIAHNLPSSGNIDGYALKRMGKFFTPMATNKVLIHFSDGQPAGSPSGFTAGGYVKKVTQDLRNEGIVVLSMSTVESVVKNNDDLYGKQFNYAAFGSRLGIELQRVVMAIAAHG